VIQARGILFLMGAFAAAACAENLTVTLQRGAELYDGVDDVFLYSPPVVANVNYGGNSSLQAGINRWNERYAGLIRFDRGPIPPNAKVLSASLFLYEHSGDYPSEDVTIHACAIAPANAGWLEGENTGDRVPVAGTPCWTFLSYDDRPWAGAPGLDQEGADYLVPPAGSATLPKGHDGWVEFKLQPGVVQQWISQPETNAGLRLYPLEDKARGQCIVAWSSDTAENPSLRPKLVVELALDDNAWREYERARGKQRLAAIMKRADALHGKAAAFGSPPRTKAALGQLDASLAKLTQALNAPDASVDALRTAAQDLQTLEEALSRAYDNLTAARAAAANQKRGLATDYALGVADSMTNVLRLPGMFEGEFPDSATIAMARNEFEPLQIVLVPIDDPLEIVRWSATPLQGPDGAVIPAEDVAISVMGYAKKIKPAINTEVEWWPVPILDFMASVDVPAGEVQSLWVCVRTRETTPPGVYHGAIKIAPANVPAKTIGLEVEVWDFDVPKEQHLLTVWGNNEKTFRGIYGDRFDDAMAHAMFRFFLDHRLAVNTLYMPQSAGKPIVLDVGYPTLSEPAELRALWDAGSRWWNLGYLHPTFAKEAGLSFDDYIPRFIEMMRESLRVAQEAGWPKTNLAIYCFDEAKEMDAVAKAAAKLKEAFPDIALMTTAYDRSYGVKGGPLDAAMDIWCPLTPRYAEDWELIKEGRAKGKKAWWYVCCGPAGSHLNFFSQFPAIRPRLLMGAATWKYQPDGFLYYRVSGWRNYEKPIGSGPLANDYRPYYLPGPDGDGELICPGPNGPLSTLQFENIRDGIEDYEYYWVLQNLVSKVQATGRTAESEARLLTIPEDLLASLTEYTGEPARLRAERRSIAEAIVRLKNALNQ